MNKIIIFSMAFIAFFFVTACGEKVKDSVEYQKTLSIAESMAEGLMGESLDLDDVRRGERILAWLKRIESHPRVSTELITATLFPKWKYMIVDWAGETPVDGIFVEFKDEEMIHIPFELMYIENNEKARATYIVFDTVVALDDALLLKMVQHDSPIQIKLSSQGKEVSDSIALCVK